MHQVCPPIVSILPNGTGHSFSADRTPPDFPDRAGKGNPGGETDCNGLFMDINFKRIGLVLAIPMVLLAGYLLVYALLRLGGWLKVSHDGWHANALELRGWRMVTAFWLLEAFHFLLQLESGWRQNRHVHRRLQAPAEPPVSDVVVEVVSLA